MKNEEWSKATEKEKNEYIYAKQNEYIKTKGGALQLIVYLAYNYDGYNTVDNLKSLIDEIVNVAKIGLTK